MIKMREIIEQPTVDLREILKKRIKEFGGRNKFVEAVNISLSALNWKLSRRKRKDGNHEEIYLDEFKIWFKLLTGKKFIVISEEIEKLPETVVNLIQGKNEEEALDIIENYNTFAEKYGI